MVDTHPSKPGTTSVNWSGLEPTTPFDEIIELYMRDVDRTLIRTNLALSPTARLRKLEEFVDFLEQLRQARRVPG